MTRKEFLALVAAGSVTPSLAQTEPQSVPATPAAKPAAKKPAASLKLPSIQPSPAYLLAGPMVGHVGPSEARLWVRATAAVPWSVQISESASLENAREIPGPELHVDSATTGTAIISGLKPATRYFYRLSLEGRPQTVAPYPSFITAPATGEKGRVRILFGSCVGDSLAAAAPAWGELAARRDSGPVAGGFDLLLMLGDNHYANTTEPNKLRTYYTVHRLSSGWRDLSANCPTYAIWDDHDFGPDNSDGTQPGKEESLRVFKEFWANPAAGEENNPGCYFTFQRGDVQFFMLDGRYHRSPDKAPDTEEKTMFGVAQLAWLKRELSASKAKIKILANGSEWETFGSDDSYSLYRHERDPFFAWIDEQKIEGVILLSGDRHFSSAYHVLGRFLELSSGPFGSMNARIRPNKERFSGHDEGSLWMILDIDTAKVEEPAVAYELWQAGGGMLERRTLTWKQLHGSDVIAASTLPLRPPRFAPLPPASTPAPLKPA